MQSTFLRRVAGIFLAVFFLGVSLSSYGQGLTTSALNGFVTTKDGKPVAGATVVAVHEESGTRSTTTTRANGQYNLTNLRPGGPYSITITAPDFPAETRKGIYLDLQEAAVQNFTQAAEVVQLEAFNVNESKDIIFGSSKSGTGTSYNSAEILNIPSVRRDVQDIAKTDPRFSITPNTSTGEFQLSAQGQNYRYNSFLIDGVKAVDPFGLNGSGFSSLRSPIPPEALEAISIELNPYDVRRSGFTGGLISAQIKSGTNDFHGSTYIEYSDQRLRHSNPLTGVKEPFHERSFGATIGGPIIKDKLFFFFAYDDYLKGAPAPTANFIPDASQLSQIIAKAQSYGYNPGVLGGASSVSKQKTYIGKLDWNINDAQRLTVTYRRNDGLAPVFANFTSTTATSLSNYWYDAPRITDSYTAQLFSSWTSDFRTEATVSYSKYDGSPKNHGTPFPEVIVNGLNGTRLDTGAAITSGGLDFGTEFSRQLNVLKTKTSSGSLYGDYSLGDHTITFGGDVEKDQYDDRFIQAANGSYTFNTLQDWLNGVVAQNAAGRGAYTLSTPLPGYTLNQDFAAFDYYNYGAIIQDTWKPNTHLIVVGGIRFDDPYVPTKTIFSQSFYNAFGFANNTTNSGNYTVAPRLSFNYDFQTARRTQIRGGIGLFQGTNPAVWIGDPYQNNGSVGRVSANTRNTSITFNPNPATQAAPVGTPPLPVFNVTDPKFRQPIAWKGNLAVDYTLPWQGIIFTAEYNELKMVESPYVTDLNLAGAPAGAPSTLPDGRIRYAGNISPAYSGNDASGNPIISTSPRSAIAANPNFSDVYYMTDSNKGGSQSITFEFRRPMKDHWAASIGYTHTHATEVNPMTSSVQQSNYNSRAVFNPNDNIATRSNYDQPHKIVATAFYQMELIKKFPTTFSVVYEGTTGHPYSYVFKGDANGDGFTNNDLFYVPSGPSDPKVAWNSTTERDAFFAWAGANGLMKYAGRVAPRNSETSNWINTVDIEITQQIPIYRNIKTELYVKCLDFANLIDKKWGRVIDQDFPYTYTVAGATYNPTANQYTYFYNSNTTGSINVLTELSRWQVQVGARIKF